MGRLPDDTGAKIDRYFRSASFSQLLSKGLKSSKGQLRNLCNSMAAEANRQLSDAMDLAHLKVISGAFSYNDAVYAAVKSLADKGIARVEYPSGRRDNADVCVRRAVLSSVNKSCCDIQLDLAREVGSNYVEVTAHIGARPSHAEWQGQIYSLVKGDPKYPYFYDATGYGTGEGLGGWNCRHNFFPYFEGIDTPYHSPDFTKTENNEYYALTQKQRAYERAVRDSKRQLAALDGARQSAEDPRLRARLDSDFARRSVTLKNREARLDAFIRDNDLQRDNSRVRVAGFGKSVSRKAVAAVQDNVSAKDIKQLAKKIYDSTNDLPVPIKITEIPGGHGNRISNIIDNSPEVIKRHLASGDVMVRNFVAEGTSNYSYLHKSIQFNAVKDMNNPNGQYTTLFHESGHFIDDLLGRPSQNETFRKALKSDFDTVVYNVGFQINSFDKVKIYDAISADLKSNKFTDSISDIIGGLTHNKCIGNAGHDAKYWNDSTKLSKEAFAHFFSATTRNSKYELENIKRIFPNAYNEFIKLLEVP